MCKIKKMERKHDAKTLFLQCVSQIRAKIQSNQSTRILEVIPLLSNIL